MSYTIEQRDNELIGTSAAITYRITFPQAAQHLFNVEMRVATTVAELVLAMPSWIPGSYMVRDFISNQGDVRAEDAAGNALTAEWLGKNRLRVVAGGDEVVLRYSYYANIRTVRQSHVNRSHAFINPANCLMSVEGRTSEIHHVAIEHPWAAVSTALSPVRDGVWGALNYDILADSPIEIGDHYRCLYERHGAMHEVAVTGVGDFDPDWLAEQTTRIVDHAIEMWGSLPYDRYVFIIHLLPGQYGGLEHARSSVNMFDSEVFTDRRKVVKLLVLLCHEYFHLWNVKRIRPRELGPFDYNAENPTRMLWLAEGVTSYYDDLSAYRCGFHSRAEYLAALGAEHLERLQDVPGRAVMSVKDSSFLAWVKLYVPTPDSTNRWPSYYLKGGVIFMLLDLWIIAETSGARSLDDGMRALMLRYQAEPGIGVTEEEFIAIVGAAVGLEIGPVLRPWLDTTNELPIADIVSRVGLRWQVVNQASGTSTFGAGLAFQPEPLVKWTGLQVEETKSGLKVAKVVRDSPAERAGIGADDEVIALQGIRVTTTNQYNVVMRSLAGLAQLTVTAASEGRLYTAVVAPETRERFELVENPDATPAEKALLERWLRRA